MDETAVDDFADQILAALEAEPRLLPVADHVWEILSAVSQVVATVAQAIESAGYRQHVCSELANHVATLPQRLDAARRPKLRIVA